MATAKKLRRSRKPKLIIKHEDSVAIAEQLDNSMLFNPYKISDFPQVKSLVETIFQEMKDENLVPFQKRYSDKLRDHVRPTILNLCAAYFSDPSKYVAYHRNRNQYGKGTRYNKLFLSYSNLVLKVINFLSDHGYIEDIRGVYFADTKKVSRMRATPKLMQLVEDHKVTLPMITTDIEKDVLILRDESKNDIDYEDTEETLRMKEDLRIINGNLQNHAILLYVTDDELKALNTRLNSDRDPEKTSIDFSRKTLRRIFNNGSFEQGGRFYGGWWENIPREYRKFIRLNEKDTVELDFSGLHVNMLYAMENLPLPEGDVYHLDGYSNDQIFRKFVKQLLLAMVNSSGRDTTRKALHKEVHLKKTLQLPEEIPSLKQADIFPLIDAFSKKHEPISHYFNSGKGIDLQFLDSEIADRVMVQFSKMHYAILPIHDSFIAYSGEVGHRIRVIPAARSRAKRPPIPVIVATP